MTRVEILLTVNGRRERRTDVPVDERLLDTLRWRLGLKGTKEGCRTGDCGACTVLVDGQTTLSCLTLSHEVNGTTITTIEGVSDDPAGRKVQAAFEKESALQCGYCTPGFVVALTALLRSNPRGVSEEKVVEELGGNLCRCTGYAAIRRAAQAVAGARR